jgi:hypothetical protein
MERVTLRGAVTNGVVADAGGTGNLNNSGKKDATADLGIYARTRGSGASAFRRMNVWLGPAGPVQRRPVAGNLCNNNVCLIE